MDIKMDQVDEFALKGAFDRLEALLCDMRFLACEREWHSIGVMAYGAINAVKTVKYELGLFGAKS